MNNSTFNTQPTVNDTKHKTITIDTRYKEIYYQSATPVVKETPETLQHRHVFWNYMMHVSMQNTISQMAKVS